MKKASLKTFSKIVACILGFFGIATLTESCAMYGSPSAEFIVKGTVTDEISNKPIRNIQVVLPFPHCNYGDTVFTDAQGKYVFRQHDIPYLNVQRIVIASDIDGDENGTYASDTLKFRFTKEDRIKRGRGSWDEGTFEKNNQNFKLKRTDK